MRRRIDIHIERVVVDARTGLDRRSLAAAIETELAAHLRAPGTLETLAERNSAAIDGGTVGVGDTAGAVGRRIGGIVSGRRES